MPSHRRTALLALLAAVAALAALGPASARSLAEDGSAQQPLAEGGGLIPAAAAPAPAPAAAVTTCTVAAASAVNRTEVDGSRAPPQQGPMAVPDAFLGQALLTVTVPGGAGGSTIDVDVLPADGHTPAAVLRAQQEQQARSQALVAQDGSAAAPAPAPAATTTTTPATLLRLTATLAANGTASVAYESRSYANDLTPRAVTVNGVACDIVQASVAAPPLDMPTEETVPGLASFAAARPLTTKDGRIIGVDGKPLIVKGINWFGFENGQTNPDGLWGNVGNALVADFVNVVWRMQLLGFNTIRLPFSFSQFESAAPKDPKYGGCNPADDGTVAASVTPPGVATPSPASMPKPRAPLKNRVPSTCNEYLPPSAGLRNRFFWAMRYIASNGFYVIIDDHLAYDTTALDDEDKWVASWRALAADIGRDPLLRGRVMLDILNEPDSRGIKWSSGHPRGGGMARLYERAMDAIHAASPSSLMLIEGTGQLGTVAMNWGDGFATQPAVVKAGGGVDDAAPFFARLARKPYLDKVVISPHIYPPTISTHHEPDVVTGKGLQSRLMNSWGYLTTQGYAGHRFPAVIGETGSRFTDAQDVAMMADFAGELRRLGAGVVYWCWNANSGDTGGIVKDDWININWEKVAWMQKAVGLHPWALGSSNAAINPGNSPAASPSQYGANPSFNQGGNNGGGGNNGCWDEAPPGQAFSCQQQKDWGKCGEGWMWSAGAPQHGWCAKTCGRC